MRSHASDPLGAADGKRLTGRSVVRGANRLLDGVEATMMVVSMGLVTVVITVQVALRYFFNESLSWAEELTRYTIVWMSFIGASMGVRRGGHISVDLLATMVRPALRRPLLAISAGLGLCFALGMLVYGSELFLQALRTGQVSSAMRMPMFVVYSVFPVSATLLLIRFGQVLATALTGADLVEPSGELKRGG